MAINYSYDRENNIARFSVTGYISVDEYFEATNWLLNSKDFSPDVNAIWDVREMQFDNIDIHFQQKMIDWHKQRNNPRRTASVALVSNYPLGDPILKLFKNLATESYRHINIFRTLDDAIAWLNEPRSE